VGCKRPDPFGRQRRRQAPIGRPSRHGVHRDCHRPLPCLAAGAAADAASNCLIWAFAAAPAMLQNFGVSAP
jgi:hypothetical protein